MKFTNFTELERSMLTSMFKAIENLYEIDDKLQSALFGEVAVDSRISDVCNDMFGTVRGYIESIGVNAVCIPEEITAAREAKRYSDAILLLEEWLRKELIRKEL